MKDTRSLVSVFVLTGAVILGSAAAAQAASESGYCHKTFPAIREETLFWDKPVLKDPAEGDLVSYSGPCNYNPLDKSEIQQQRAQFRRDKKNNEKD